MKVQKQFNEICCVGIEMNSMLEMYVAHLTSKISPGYTHIQSKKVPICVLKGVDLAHYEIAHHYLLDVPD